MRSFTSLSNFRPASSPPRRRAINLHSITTHRTKCGLSPVALAASQKVEQQGGDGDGKELSTVLRLALPALGIVLSDPLQTLVDSACVGRQSTIQLAALGPNTAIFNSVFQIFSFLGIATANFVATNSLVAEGLDAHELEKRKAAAASSLWTALTLAVVLGILGATILHLYGHKWLVSMGTDPKVLPLASQYLAIRAGATPAVLIMNACSGACLGQQDTLTPMYVCIIATLINIVGDIYLVFGLHMGVAGAAFATAGAQVCAAALLLFWVHRKGTRPLGVPLRYCGVPSWSNLQPFFSAAVTLVLRTCVGMIAYFSMTVYATGLGTTIAAAHQIAMQMFWFISFFPEPLSMAAQSLIAKERSNPIAAKKWAWLLVRQGLVFGCILAAAVAAAFQFIPGLFTTDIAVQSIVQSVAPLGALAMGVCGVMMMLDGVSIGAGSMRHLPVAVGMGMVAVLSMLWYGAKVGAGLKGVWWALVAFYATRLAGHLMYYAMTWKYSVFFGSPPSPLSGGFKAESGGADDDKSATATAAAA